MGFLVVLVVVSLLVLGVFIASKSANSCAGDCGGCDSNPEVANSDGLGAPLLFIAENNKWDFVPADEFDFKNLTAITPEGPQEVNLEAQEKLTKSQHGDGKLYLENARYKVSAQWDKNYFSESVANKLQRDRGAWRVSKCEEKTQPKLSNGTVPVKLVKSKYRRSSQRLNQTFFENNDSIYDFSDLMEDMIFCHFLFDGFVEPLDYYSEVFPSCDADGLVDGFYTAEEFENFNVDSPVPTVEEGQGIRSVSNQEVLDEMSHRLDDQRYDPPAPVYEPPTPSYDPPSSGGWSGGSDYGSSDSGGGCDSGGCD